MQAVDLAALAAETVRMYEPLVRSFGALLLAEPYRAERPWVPPPPAAGDPELVLQLLSNLVENAIGWTPAEGRVVLRAAPHEVQVEDDGPGLGPEDIPRAFEPGYLHRRYGGDRSVGSEQGLAAVKELTEAMGGTVSVRSTKGVGTTFTVSLPVFVDSPPGEARPGRTGTSSI
jgi:signal transduction histidine kinase